MTVRVTTSRCLSHRLQRYSTAILCYAFTPELSNVSVSPWNRAIYRNLSGPSKAKNVNVVQD